MKISTASGSASRTWRAPCTSISSTIPRAGRSQLASQRPIAVSGVFGVFDELAGGHPPSKSSSLRKW